MIMEGALFKPKDCKNTPHMKDCFNGSWQIHDLVSCQGSQTTYDQE